MATPEQIRARLGRNRNKQQTDDVRLGHLQRHYSDHPSLGLTPARAAEILQAAERGDLIAQCELAEDLEEKDGHLFAELSKRKLALLPVDWTITPPRDASAQEKKDAAMIQAMLEDGGWLPDAIRDMSDAILKGFACLEHQWVADGRHQLLDPPQFRDPAWFQTHPDNRNQLRLRDASAEGAELWPMGWITHTHQAKSGYLGRGGLVRQLVWPFIFKNYSVRDLAEFLEIYGLPLRLGQYPSGASEQEKRDLMRAVMSIGHNAGGIMPKGMAIDFHNAADGQAGPFELMITYMDKVLSKAILGATLTSGADGKSSTNALGNVHNEVRTEIRDADLTQLAATLTRDVVGPLYMLNGRSYHSPRRLPRFEFDTTDPEDIGTFSEALPKLAGSGMRIAVSWAHDKLQIPEAKEGEAVLTGDTAKPGTEPLPELAKPVPLAALEAQPQPQTQTQAQQSADNLDGFTNQLEAQAAPLMQSLTEPVRQMVMQATSLEELREQLLTLESQLDQSELQALMQQAMAAAFLLGQVEVEEEAQEGSGQESEQSAEGQGDD
ncbi:DUF935 domain-containing protein [Ferrimonas sp.]|uniref:DUF935 domain-containing protein n=1 Tax=Ferrimonas sp. TaxID=2080861 RepID=UPI003A8EA9A0